MHFQYVPYIWPFIATVIITLGLSIYAFHQKNIRGAFPFGLCMLATSLWAGSYALELAGVDLTTKLFCTNVQVIGYTLAPVIWLIMVFRFIERDYWITRQNIWLLLLLPFLAMILAWTNQMHGLMWQDSHLDTSGPFPVLDKVLGPGFWVTAGYSYLLNILSELLLGLSWRRKSALYREQSIALFVGLALIFIQNALYIFRIHPIERYDLTSAIAGLSGLIIAWGIFHFRLFDIVPVARDNIIEKMSDGLIVLDARNRIADMNLTAKTIFGSTSADAIGQKADALFKNWPAFNIKNNCGENLPGELTLEKEGLIKIYEVSYLQLTDKRGRNTGLSINFHDVTERKRVQSKLLEQQKALVMAEERERLARDLHDNLGQIFGFINVQAQAIKHELNSAGINIASTKIERLVEVARSGHRDMREYIQNIMITTAFERDFCAVLKRETDQFSKQTGVVVRLDITPDSPVEDLKPDIKNQIYNIIKEALNNVRKHAQAKNVFIAIEFTDKEFSLIIKDDGKGFDIAHLGKKPAPGLGLNIMHKRVEEIKGKLKIVSGPEHGTQIIVTIPGDPKESYYADKSNAG